MNWDELKGDWKQLKGEAHKQWGKLTDEDWEETKGDSSKIIGKLQHRYGWTKEKAEQEYRHWEQSGGQRKAS